VEGPVVEECAYLANELFEFREVHSRADRTDVQVLEQQVPPLRFAPVGMTKKRVA
jgi:hypothetical protein